MTYLHLQNQYNSLAWNDDAIAAFRNTKEALATPSLLSYPAPDAPTCLMTDASVLQQHIEGSWHPISFFSKKMTSTEKRYSTFDRELLAVYLAIKHFKTFSGMQTIPCFHRSQTANLCLEYSLRSSLTSSSTATRLHLTVLFQHPTCPGI